MYKKIEIQLNKKRIILYILFSAIFIAFGCVGFIYPEKLVSTIFRNLEIIRIFGALSILFFGLSFLFLIKKVSGNKIGLTIDQYGITDNSNSTSIGLIEWEDIIGIKRIQVISNNILIILTDKPDKYIRRAKNVISKKIMEANYKRYGTPISIISNSLKIDFKELETLILREWEKQK